MNVPSPIHVGAVGAKVMETWEQHPGVAVLESVEIIRPLFPAPVIAEVTAALARATMESLSIDLGDNDEDNMKQGLALANAGLLFSTLLCGTAGCKVPGASLLSPSRRGEINCLNVTHGSRSALRLGVIYSALAEASSTEKVDITARDWNYLGSRLPENRSHWEWLAYAFWSKVSVSSVSDLRLSWIVLRESDAAAVETVLSTCYPEVDKNQSSTLEYGFVSIPEGTELRHRGIDDGTKLELTRSCYCRAAYDATNDRVNVVVPGYGICDVALREGVDVFPSDPSKGDRVSAMDGAQLRSVYFHFERVESSRAVEGLLTVIGGKLETLWLELYDDIMGFELSAVAAACPNLKSLGLIGFNVSMSVDTDSLRNWGIQNLHIQGSEEVEELDAILSDPLYRMTRELVKLEVHIKDGYARVGYVERLKAHNGDYLSIAEKKFAVESKIAMISAARSRGQGKRFSRNERKTSVENVRVLSVVHCLDDNILSLIFEFAATPKQRTVKHSDRYEPPPSGRKCVPRKSSKLAAYQHQQTRNDKLTLDFEKIKEHSERTLQTGRGGLELWIYRRVCVESCFSVVNIDTTNSISQGNSLCGVIRTAGITNRDGLDNTA